jgi:plasmid stabilization system protein ParE
VKLIIQTAAEDDMLRQFDWYEDQGLSDIADRFDLAVRASISAALKRPKAGAPKHLRNPQLAGLRSWSVEGFDEFHVYYLIRDDAFTVVRILHDKRDVSSILGKQSLDDPGSKID